MGTASVLQLLFGGYTPPGVSVERRSRAPSAGVWVVLIILAAASFGGWRWWKRRMLDANERNAADCLETLATAETDFRANDRDGNRVHDFWTADVAGLHVLGGPTGVPGQTASIRLIDARIAEADASHPDARPFRGYHFRAMDLDEEGVPYRQETTGNPRRAKEKNTTKFGFCAYPAAYGRTGRWTYVVNEGRTIFKLDTEGKPVLRFPCDPTAPPTGPKVIE